MPSKLTVDFVLGLLKKAWPFIIIGALACALYVTRDTLQDTKDDLKVELEFRAGVANFANAKTGTRKEIMVNLYAIGQTSLNRKAALERISNEALTAHERSKAADEALKRVQADNAKKFAAAQRRISDLENRKGSGDAAADLKTIEQDSQAAWKGWK